MQCVIITGSLQFNTMRTMGRHNWFNVLVKHKVVFSWSLLLPHNTSYCGQESASGMPCILVLIREEVFSSIYIYTRKTICQFLFLVTF